MDEKLAKSILRGITYSQGRNKVSNRPVKEVTITVQDLLDMYKKQAEDYKKQMEFFRRMVVSSGVMVWLSTVQTLLSEATVDAVRFLLRKPSLRTPGQICLCAIST